jgi:DNA modification methylase
MEQQTDTVLEAAAVWVPIDRLHPWPGNPRKNAKAVDEVTRAIKRFGWGAPIVAREADGEIIAGHTRYLAAQKLGLDRVPVRFLKLDPADAHLLAVADNKTGEIADWDDDKLAAVLAELRAADVDLLEGTGLSERELRALLADGTGGHGGTDPGATEPPANPVSERGTIYELGAHRLLCGDSTNRDDVLRLLGGEKAALCATDPPYLVDYTGERPDHDGGNKGGKDWTAVYHEIDIKDATGFFRSLFTNVLEVLAPHSAIYCWHAHKRVADIVAVWRELGIHDHQQIIWVKPTPVFGRVFWHFRHEPCLMGWRKGSIPPHDGDQSTNSVWEIDWEGKARVVGNEHPTQKPLEIFARPIRKHTRPGDICFEPFSGSGSQLISAAREGRRCFAIEIEPAFVDVARKRWTTYARSAGIDPGPGALD